MSLVLTAFLLISSPEDNTKTINPVLINLDLIIAVLQLNKIFEYLRNNIFILFYQLEMFPSTFHVHFPLSRKGVLFSLRQEDEAGITKFRIHPPHPLLASIRITVS